MGSMSAATSTPARPRLLSPHLGLVLLAASVAWLATVAWTQGMGAAPGTMGLGVAAFVAMWTLMMAAMMLPATAPLASMYSRSVVERRVARLGSFGAGYVLVWAATALPAFLLAWTAGGLARGHPSAATAMAAIVFAAAGLYQLTPLKDRCLARCRSPLAQLLRYGSLRGPLRDLRAGAHHGAFCLGCCWALMALLVAFGVMNILAVVALAGVATVEKLWTRGPAFSRVTGLVALGLALAVIWIPSLAPGLHGGMSAQMGGM
jgi:predicted metal-binding membrane protein